MIVQLAKSENRKCNTCTMIKHIDYFKYADSRSEQGWRFRNQCKDCKRRQNREQRKNKYQNDHEWRNKTLATQRERVRANPKPNSEPEIKWKWVDWRVKRHFNRFVDKTIVYIIPSPEPVQLKRDSKYKFSGKTFAFREDKPPINAPRFGIPVIRVYGDHAFRHPLCPAEWEWVVHFVNLRLKNIRKKNGNEQKRTEEKED